VTTNQNICNMLQHTASNCTTRCIISQHMHHTKLHCDHTLNYSRAHSLCFSLSRSLSFSQQIFIETDSSTLNYTASHCIALHRTASHCNTLRHAVPHRPAHCNTLQHTTTQELARAAWTGKITLHHTASHRITHCITHCTTHCKTGGGTSVEIS